MIYFTKHAEEKFRILKKHRFFVSKEQVVQVVMNPDKLDYSRIPLLIAQRNIDRGHVLRVVYKKEERMIKIITFYPGRSKQYE